MGQENVDIVREIHDAWRQGDFSSSDWADPEIEFITQGPEVPAGTGVRGIEAMARTWREWLGAWEDFHAEPEEFIDGGDSVLVLVRFRGRGKSSGLSVEELPGANVHTLAEGKIVRLALYTDRQQALDDFRQRTGETAA
jgi:uncharacterized protein